MLMALCAGGCAVGSYKPSVDAFATATGKASDAYAGLQAAIISAHTSALERQALQGKLRIHPVPGDCGTESARCRLEATSKAETSQALAPEFSSIVVVMHDIADYAAGLQGIVNADAAQQVGASLTAAAGSVVTLANEVATLPGGKPLGVDPAALAAPSASIAAWLAGEYINLLQVDALRKATGAADPHIQQARRLLEGVATAALTTMRADAADEVGRAKDALVDAPKDKDKLDRLVAAAAKFDTMLTAKPDAVFADMAAAHRKLTDSLDGKNITVAEVFAAVQQFAQRAEALGKLLAQLQAAQAKTAATKS